MTEINENFHKGDVLIGMVDGNIFTVVDVLPPGRYETSTGGVWVEPKARIVFRDKRKSRTSVCSLALARHLLLKKLQIGK